VQKRKRSAHTHIDLGTHLHVNTLHLITSAVIFICAHVIHLITAACRCVRRWKHLIPLITAMCSQVHCCNEMYKVFPSLYVYYTAVIRCITSVPYTSHYSSNDLFQKNPGAAGSFSHTTPLATRILCNRTAHTRAYMGTDLHTHTLLQQQ